MRYLLRYKCSSCFTFWVCLTLTAARISFVSICLISRWILVRGRKNWTRGGIVTKRTCSDRQGRCQGHRSGMKVTSEGPDISPNEGTLELTNNKLGIWGICEIIWKSGGPEKIRPLEPIWVIKIIREKRSKRNSVRVKLYKVNVQLKRTVPKRKCEIRKPR